MASATPAFPHSFFHTYHHIGVCSHVPGNQYRLPHFPVNIRYIGMVSWKSSGSSFTVHKDSLFPPVYQMLFKFAYVVADIVDKIHPQISGRKAKYSLENLPCPVHYYLSVCPGIVGSSGHGCKVVFSFGRIQGSTGELPIR